MRMTIRLARSEDAAGCLEIYAPVVEEGAVSFESSPPSLSQMEARIARVLVFAPWLVLEEDGRIGAYAYGTRFRERDAYAWTVETAIYVAEPLRGRGVGRRLYATLLEALRLQGFRSAVGVITLPNEPSLRLHASLGFVRSGVLPNVGFKCGSWHDVALLMRDLRPGVLEPAPLVSLDELEVKEEFQALLRRR